MNIYAQILGGAVVNTILLNNSALVSTFSVGFDAFVKIDSLSPQPGVGWSYAGGVFTAPTQTAQNNQILVYAASSPNRSLNMVFMPSATDATMCHYTISIACTISITTGQTGSVTLFSDKGSPPTTFRGRVTNNNTGALTIGLNLTNTQETVLSYLVPPGYNVELVSSGTGTISITGQSEVIVGN